MKKLFIFALIFISMLFIACAENNKDYVLDCEDYFVTIDNTVTISPFTDKKNANFELSSDSDIINIDGLNVTGIKNGVATINVSLVGTELNKDIKIYVCDEGLTIFGPNEVVIDNVINLELIKNGVNDDERIIWRSSDTNIAVVSKGVVTALDYGKVTISAETDVYAASIEIEVVRPIPTSFVIENDKSEIKYELGATYELNISVTPENAKRDFEITVNNDNVSIDDTNVNANKLGTSVITVKSLSNPDLVKTINVNVVENEKPVFTKLDSFSDVLVVNYGSIANLSEGLQVIDNVDGDITNMVYCDEENLELLKIYGEKEIEIIAKDKAGNMETFKRKVNVTWQYHTKFIGHMGSIYGVANSEKAFIYAASVLKYQALECDLHRTKDGVFVISHDADFAGVDIGSHTYDELKDIVKTSKPFALPKQYGLAEESYTDHICTLERYLQICKQYGVEAVIELKGNGGINNSDQSGMPALMKLIEDCDMLDQTILLSSSYNCLIWARENGYTLPCQYLMNMCNSEAAYERCIKYNLDISICVTYGDYTDKLSKEERIEYQNNWIKRYMDAGCKVSVWTFTSYCDYDQVQEWIDFGVDYVTCDWHHMDKLNLK